MTYQLTAVAGIIKRTSDGAFIPVGEGNVDYQAYLAWVEEGNTPEPAPAAEPEQPAVPSSVTQRQARRALLDAGKYTQVQNAIAAAEGPEADALRIDWEFASTIDRTSPSVAVLADILGWSDADLDALFVAAGGL